MANGSDVVADELPEASLSAMTCAGHAVVAHEREREAPVGRGALAVALAVGGRGSSAATVAPERARDRGGQARVVEVVVRDQQDELEVLERAPASAQARLERGQRLVRARAGVDERQRVAAQQPCVDRADVRQRERGSGRCLPSRVSVPEPTSSMNRVQYWHKREHRRRRRPRISPSISRLAIASEPCMI